MSELFIGLKIVQRKNTKTIKNIGYINTIFI